MNEISTKRYSGKTFTGADIQMIRDMIQSDPKINRQRLSYRVCERLNWRKTDGGLKDMSCRVALLRMYREGLIDLPAPKHKYVPNRSFSRRTPAAAAQAELSCPVGALHDLHLKLVDRKSSALWNEYIDRYHYLKYKPLPGAQLRYFAFAGDRVVALFGFGAAAWKTRPRDEYIGWTREQRHRNLDGIVNNARFLILPWIQVPHLASKLLGKVVRVLPDDWQCRYRHRPVLLETFVEQDRFQGTCYRAANWQGVGHTQGRGKLGDQRVGQVPIKQVLVYPLSKHFRARLCQ